MDDHHHEGEAPDLVSLSQEQEPVQWEKLSLRPQSRRRGLRVSSGHPTHNMPGWLKTISHLNLLIYVVDALRTFMLAGSTSTFGLGADYAVIFLTTIILACIGARLYPHLAT